METCTKMAEIKRSVRSRIVVAGGILAALALLIAAMLWFVSWLFVELDDSRTPPGHPELSDQQ